MSHRNGPKPGLDEATVRQAHGDYYLRDASWRVLEARYGILHGSLYNAFRRLGLPLRSAR